MGSFDTFTFDVNAVSRTYKKAYVSKYAAQLKAQNTITLKADITDGVSYARISHDEVTSEGKTLQRHLVALEDRVTDSDGVLHIRKSHKVIQCDAGDPAEETAVGHLDVGLDALVAQTDFRDELVNGEL